VRTSTSTFGKGLEARFSVGEMSRDGLTVTGSVGPSSPVSLKWSCKWLCKTGAIGRQDRRGTLWIEANGTS
jgi:hypothetical protein